MREVSCRGTAMVLDFVESRGVDVSTLIDGLPVTEGELRDPFGRTDWDTAAELCSRVGELFSASDLERIGESHVRSPAFRGVQRVAGLLASPRDLYSRGMRWLGRALFTIIRDESEDLPDGRIRQTLQIPEGFRDSPEIFRIVRGAIRAAPRMLSLPDSEVEVQIEPRRAVYTITPPPSMTLWARIRRATRAIFSPDGLMDELGAQQIQLKQSYDELRAAYDRIEEQARHLERARSALERDVHARTVDLSRANEALVKEVGERTAVESALSKVTREAELILDCVSDGIYGLDADAVVSFMNPAAAEMLGGSAEDFVGQRLHDAIPHSSVAGGPCSEESCAIESVLEAGRPCSREDDVLVRRDGTHLAVDWVSAPLRAGGRVVGAVVTFRDIGERRQLEARVRSAERMESLGVMAGGVAHDFNNLLAVILGQASLALDTLPEGSDCGGHLGRVITAAERAVDLTQQMLVFAGRGALQYAGVLLNDLIRDNADLFADSLPASVELRLELADELPPIEADAGQMQQVIMNLLLNAAEAIGSEHGTVTVSTFARTVSETERWVTPYAAEPLAPGEYVALRVLDTGAGIESEKLSQIFDPFFTTKFTGRGLGLSAVLGIVRAHRGGIRVESRVGEGTTFELLLPAAVAAQPPAPVVRAQPAEVGGSILVVDDEEAVREVLEQILVRAGFCVLTASDGATAVEVYRERPDAVDLVILDLSMPGMDGEATLAALRKIDRSVRVLLTSGYSETDALARFGAGDLVGFLPKPFEPRELVDLVREHLVVDAVD